ncbi:thiol:disulfide interchange protein DsbG [Marinobacter sp.]|uniref:thiol:disulfide interchange protein DsbG n=1 Tax=Marinobacter sp. TaxID=50741 RepID=UPI003564C6D8
MPIRLHANRARGNAAALAGALLTLTATSAIAEDYPRAIAQLESRGAEIVGEFDAPGGMKGYVGEMQGRPMSAFLTADGKHVIIGTLLAEDGTNISQEQVEKLLMEPRFAEAWGQLEDSDWVADGSDDADVVLYTFTDPNCPYCYRFREMADPWIQAGKVQLRHIMVGILKEDSAPKAATILAADDPEKALREHHENYEDGGIEVDRSVVSQTYNDVMANGELMSSLGLQATPSTFYRNPEGKIAMKPGVPNPKDLETMMGGPKP